tara:strand:- start:69 stop:398 length:330 start_codon:yes stop_codon:yes gene_type:complete
MNNQIGFLVLFGVVAITAIPSIRSSIATPVRQQFQLTTGQKEFIRQFDEALGTKILPVASSAAAVPIVKAATIACGDTALQREAIFAVGGNQWQANDATQKFEELFCAH